MSLLPSSSKALLSLFACLTTILFMGCRAEQNPSSVSAQTVHETKTGLASYYGQAFQGQETASGEVFDKQELVAAHPTYPAGTKVRVTNLGNNQVVEVRVIDRGPTPTNQAEGVIIDLSKEAAKQLDMIKDGRVQVKTEVLEWGDNDRK